MLEPVNEIAVLVSALLAVAVWSVWYSPFLFGIRGMTSIDTVRTNREMILMISKEVFVWCIFFFALAQFIGLSIVYDIPMRTMGIFLTILLALSTVQAFVRGEQKFFDMVIHAGYITIVVFGGIGIIGYWPW